MSGGGGPGSPIWGDVTGDITDQTDLMGKLDGKSFTNHSHTELHSHDNKELLDTYAQEESNLSAAVIQMHSNALDHSNSLDHSNASDPTTGQKAALAGTSGTPGDTNRYVTKDDPTNNNARTPTAHNQTQATSHDSPDTDSTPTALHHTLGAGVNQAASGTHTHAGGSATPDLHYTRRTGATAPERWYSYPCQPVALTTGAVTANRLYAFPFICPKQITLDRIAINVTTLLAGNARLGIYDDSGNCYPGARLLEAGEVSLGTAGVKSITISQTLMAGLKWLVMVASSAATLRSFAITGIKPILGWDNTLPAAIPGVGYYVTFTYAALPTPYPTASPSVVIAAPIPAVFVRISA